MTLTTDVRFVAYVNLCYT